MMSDVICMLTEYMGIILCLHAFANAKREINIFNSIFCILNVGMFYLGEKFSSKSILMSLMVYAVCLIYVRAKLEDKWLKVFKIWGLMMVIIPSLQVGFYIIIRISFKNSISAKTGSILANVLICVLFYFWSENRFYLVASYLKRKIWMIIIIVSISVMLYLFILYKTNKFVKEDTLLQIVVWIWGVILIFAMLLTAETEKKNKEKELRLYQVYNKSFEEAVITIRQRQHEFTNHINALKDMQYTICDSEKLIEERNQYCDSLLKENELNSLLKRDLESIVISVLYTKLLAAQQAGIEVSQKIHVIDFKKRIEIVELVEIIGILIDNAVEALSFEKQSIKKLRVRILSEVDKHFSIEIANSCEVLLQSEIEKFTRSGYSTKGIERGVGLARLMEIIKKNKAKVSMGNMTYEGQNYFSVRIFI